VPSFLHSLASPARFGRISARVLPWASALAVGLIGCGLVWALVFVPPDYQQGDTVRVMYIHVPAAWMAMFCYAVMAALSVSFLIWKHALADLAARASAPIGASFTAVALITGSLWGKPTWGTYWVWDARLTSVLVLLFLYLGHMALSNAFDDRERGGRAAAILAVVGAINLPIIKFSVDWWNTLHQPASVLRLDGPTIHSSMLWPLFVMAGGFTAFYVVLLLIRIRSELSARRIEVLQRHRVMEGG
jgi:heme exporter protein C